MRGGSKKRPKYTRKLVPNAVTKLANLIHQGHAPGVTFPSYVADRSRRMYAHLRPLMSGSFVFESLCRLRSRERAGARRDSPLGRSEPRRQIVELEPPGATRAGPLRDPAD